MSATTAEQVAEAVASGWPAKVVGFLWGFGIGGVTGYFGNWLWHRFGPHRSKPYFQVSSSDEGAVVEGRIDASNKGEALRLMKAIETKSVLLEALGNESTSTSPMALPNPNAANRT